MALGSLQLAIGGEIVTLEAKDIKKCVITSDEQASAAAPGASGEGEPAASQEPKPAGQAPPHVVLVQTPPSAEDAGSGDPEQLPHDVRHRSLVKQRLAALDAAYPWLCPTETTQWWSLGALLFSLLSLFIYGSVKIAGTECASFGRSVGLSLVYLGVAAVQFAFVPINDLATFALLFGDTALVLFLVRSAFGLPRLNAVLALAVQVGFLVVAFGVLQLVDSLLRSVGTVHT